MTRKIRVLVACLSAAFAVTAVISSISSAAMTLPAFSGSDKAATGSSSSGLLRIEGGAALKCEKSAANSLEVESNRNLGPGAINFAGCTEGGEECRSLGGTLGTVATTGSWHLVLNGKTEATDIHLFLFLLTLLHIECPKGTVKLFLILGNIAGLIKQKAGSNLEFEISVGTVAGEGKVQNFSEYENDAGTGIKTTLEVIQEGTGKAKKAFEESSANVLKFELATSIEK
jgi:hypothetical protein